jgi:acyl-homoserine-lactone acylase
MFPLLLNPFQKLACVFLLIFVTHTATAQVNPADVEIVRDKWGVPHIFGKTDAATTYGLAWATAEDDFETVQRMLLSVQGRLAEVDGKNGAILDFLAFISGAEAIVDTAYDGAFSPEFKKVTEAYAQGLNDYALAHPLELLRPGLFPVSPKTIVAQYVLTNMLLTDVYLDVQKIFIGDIKNYEVNLPSGSNAFTFNSSRTQDGSTYLIVNSHQPLEGPFSWYEAHLVSDEGMNILGGTFPGGMSVFHGTTPNLGWACTLNQPDLSDVFKLQMNPKNHLQYMFDGHWETLEVRKKTVHVKLGAIRIPYTKTFYWSKYGTTLKNKDGFYSIRFPANMDIKCCEQLYHLNKAKNFTEWRDVMRQGHFPGINFLYADKSDTTFYVSNGQFAHRNPKYDWRKVLPGNTSETLWQPDFYPFDSLPQVLNPTSGYLLNTNNSCFNVTGEGDNPQIKNYDATMGYPDHHNNRSIMAHYLIGAKDKLSYEDIKHIKYNHTFNDSFYHYALPNTKLIFAMNPDKYPDIADALRVIQRWNKQTDVNNREAAMVIAAITPVIDKISARGSMYEENIFTERDFVQAIKQGKRHLMKYFGTLTPALGQTQKHARGKVEMAIGGMPEVLAANVTQPYKDGMRRTYVGESYIQIARFKNGVLTLETVNAYGASSKPNSPHYTDQMQMFVDQQLKPMTLNKEEIYRAAEVTYHPKDKPVGEIKAGR